MSDILYCHIMMKQMILLWKTGKQKHTAKLFWKIKEQIWKNWNLEVFQKIGKAARKNLEVSGLNVQFPYSPEE